MMTTILVIIALVIVIVVPIIFFTATAAEKDESMSNSLLKGIGRFLLFIVFLWLIHSLGCSHSSNQDDRYETGY